MDEGKSIDDMHSVASFFVSRVDTEADKRLEALGRTDLQGTAAVANARAAYIHFKEIFHGDRFASLRDAGAHVQRPLWASTGTKNPRYSETKYVEELVAPDTVNTMPMATLLAFAERGEVTGATADAGPGAGRRRAARARRRRHRHGGRHGQAAGRRHRAVQRGDARSCSSGIDARRAGGRHRTARRRSGASIPHELEPAMVERVQRASQEDVARRVWRRDESLWGGPGVPEIGNRLGWLTIAESRCSRRPTRWRRSRRRWPRRGSPTRCCSGMGGSSLAPEVIRRTFGKAEGGARACTCSTRPTPERSSHIERTLDLEHTLFIVSTKSGGTIETLSLARYFIAALGAHGLGAGAATSSASPIRAARSWQLAEEHGWRRVFVADPDIGGRYSALSHFGMVPAALAGVDIRGDPRARPGGRAALPELRPGRGQLRPLARPR